MTDNPPAATEGDKLPETEAEERFRRLVGNLVNTPHTPQKEKEADDKPPSSR